jgi:hypothetical protein
MNAKKRFRAHLKHVYSEAGIQAMASSGSSANCSGIPHSASDTVYSHEGLTHYGLYDTVVERE